MNPSCCGIEMKRSEMAKGQPLWCKVCGRYGAPPVEKESVVDTKFTAKLVGAKAPRVIRSRTFEPALLDAMDELDNSIVGLEETRSETLREKIKRAFLYSSPLVHAVYNIAHEAAVTMEVQETCEEFYSQVSRKALEHPFKIDWIAMRGVGAKTYLTNIQVGVEEKLHLGKLPGFLFVAPFNGWKFEEWQTFEAKEIFKVPPDVIKQVKERRFLNMGTVLPGQILQLRIEGPISHLVVGGTVLLP